MKLFITGTDTHVGKTYVSCAILKYLNRSYQTIAAKLISSGHEWIDGKWMNRDAYLLQQAASIQLPLNIINPISLPSPIAPHIAAKQIQQSITAENLNISINTLLHNFADVYLFEGVGGWHVPINQHQLMSDIIIQHDFHVILVVGMRLGCLNHSILTTRALLADNVKVMGWIANCVDPQMQFIDENIATLKDFLNTPYLGTLQFNEEELNLNQIF